MIKTIKLKFIKLIYLPFKESNKIHIKQIKVDVTTVFMY